MRRKSMFAVAVVATLVLAGCSGGGTTSAPGGMSPTDQVAAEDLQSTALAEMQSVQSYQVRSNSTINITANGQTQQQTVELVGAFDRSAERFSVNQTTAVRGITQQVQIYFVDSILYQQSELYTTRYGAEWIKTNQTANIYGQLDSLHRQRALLANATVSLNHTATLDGSTVYVLESSLNETATASTIGSRLEGLGMANAAINVTSAHQRLWIDQESGLPLRASTTMELTVTSQGQSATMHMDAALTFDYDSDVSISLPSEADAAVSLD